MSALAILSLTIRKEEMMRKVAHLESFRWGLALSDLTITGLLFNCFCQID